MKKNPPNVWVRPHCVKKMLQVMKLALLFVVLFFTSASAFTQRVSLSVKAETTLNEVLKQVKDQTGVRILYDAGKMKRVSCREMKIADLEVAEALRQILKDTGNAKITASDYTDFLIQFQNSPSVGKFISQYMYSNR